VGQYFIVANLTKKEFLEPYWFGHGATLPDLGLPAGGIMTGVALLLAASGTDRYSQGPIYGRWAGDCLVLLGDYFQGSIGGYELSEENYTRIESQDDGWVDISEHVRTLLVSEWKVPLPAPDLDGSEVRSTLLEDGRIVPVKNP